MLVEHVWAHAIDDAVARTGGTELLSGFVRHSELTELVPELVVAVAAVSEPRPA